MAFARILLHLVLAGVGLALAGPASAACGLAVGTARVAIGATGRSATLHLPPGFDPNRPAPIVLLLHGSGDTGARFLGETRLAETGDAHGFIVAAPDAGIVAGGGFLWNIPGVPTVAGTLPSPQAPDDVAYLGAMVDWLARQGCVDGARVYATGLSGGGRMTSWLGCIAAKRFAAIAPVVGLRAGRPLAGDPSRPDPATCRPERPMPVLAFAGDADTTNPIGGGGAAYWKYPMAAALQRWAALDRCTAVGTAWVAPKVYEQRYTGCAAGTEVAARVTVGGGHSWVVDNEALWAFLSRFRR